MSWRVVSLVTQKTKKPYLYLRDPDAPIHMKSYLKDGFVEVLVGGDDPNECGLRARVFDDGEVIVAASLFKANHLEILDNILAGLGVSQGVRFHAIAHLNGLKPDQHGWYEGENDFNEDETSWVENLSEKELLDGLQDPAGIPNIRRDALAKEAERRIEEHNGGDDPRWDDLMFIRRTA